MMIFNHAKTSANECETWVIIACLPPITKAMLTNINNGRVEDPNNQMSAIPTEFFEKYWWD